MIKFGTGVKIRSGIKLGHSASVEESPLVIWLTRNPDLIHIQYNGAGSPKITYTQGSGKTIDGIIIEAPSYNGAECTVPFTPAAGYTYKCVAATVWNAVQQPIVSATYVYVL